MVDFSKYLKKNEVIMKAEIIAVTKKTLPVKVPKLPPRPVWTDQIEAFLAKANGFRCNSKEDFERAKALAEEGVGLKNSILETYAPLTQAIDAIKAPVLEYRNEDVRRVEMPVKLVDSLAVAWKREQDRLAQEEANKRLEEERQKRQDEADQKRQELEAKRQKEIELAEEWGDTEAAESVPEVIVPEVIPPRPVQADSGFSYRKGARTKTVRKFLITDPDKVDRKYCSPDPQIIKAKVNNFFALVTNPTKEAIEALEREIGGGQIVEE